MFSLFLISVRVLQTCVFFRLFLSVICISYVAVQLLAVWCSSFIEERPIRCSPHINIRTCCFEDLIVLFDPQTVGKIKNSCSFDFTINFSEHVDSGLWAYNVFLR